MKDSDLWDSRSVLPAVVVLPIPHGDVVIHRAPVFATIRPPVRPGVKLSALPHHCSSHFYPHVQRLHLRTIGTRVRNQGLVVVLWGRSWRSSKHRPEIFEVISFLQLRSGHILSRNLGNKVWFWCTMALAATMVFASPNHSTYLFILRGLHCIWVLYLLYLSKTTVRGSQPSSLDWLCRRSMAVVPFAGKWE